MSRRAEGKPPVVTKVGLGYRMDIEDLLTSFHFSRVRRRSGEITGYMTVRTKLPIKTIGDDGILYVGSLNISGPRVRAEFAKQLASRAPGYDIDWDGLLDFFDQTVNAHEVMGEPIKQVGAAPVPKTAGQWAIEPFVPRGAGALFYGPGGSGKSRLALASALSIQMGREIIPGCPPSIKGNVLYLDWETDGNTVAERIQQICRGINVPAVDINYRRCVRPFVDDVEELAYFVNANSIIYVVIDSVGMALGKQSDFADAADGALRLFDAIRVLGTSTMLVDHVSKSEMRMDGKVRGLIPYGSIYKVNLARAAWEVRPVENRDDEAHVTAFYHTKANDTRLRDPFGIRADFTTTDTFDAVRFGTYDGPLGPVIEPDMSVGLPANRADQIAELLDGAKMTANDIAKYLGIDNAGIVRTTLSRYPNRFAKDGGYWRLATPRNTVAQPPTETVGQVIPMPVRNAATPKVGS